MRRLAVSIIAASLLGAVLAPPIVADTGPNETRTEFDRIQAAFDFIQAGRSYTGQIFIDRNTATGVSITSFFFFSAVDVTCDNGTPGDPSDDFDRQDLIDFTANEAPPATLSIRADLSAASASAVATGERIHLEACTDIETGSEASVSWQVALRATGHATRTTQIDRFPNDDGTVTTQTIKIVERPQAGSIRIDGRRLALRDASISHTLIGEKTR